MIKKGNLDSSVLVITSNLSKNDIFYEEPFSGLDGEFFNKLEKKFKINLGYLGFVESNEQIVDLLSLFLCNNLVLCGKKIQKIGKKLIGYNILEAHHPSYILQHSQDILDKELDKYERFFNGCIGTSG